MILATNLRTIRQVWRFTQDEMAALLGIKKGQYVAYELGRNEPNLSVMFTLEDLTDIYTRHLCLKSLSFEEIPLKPLSPTPSDELSERSPYGKLLNSILERLEKLEESRT